MKPPRFEYYDPTTVDQVLTLLQQHGDDAKLLAGGQSLVPMLNMRLARPAALIDLNRVEALSAIREEGDSLCIGAMARHAQVEHSPLVALRQPLLTEAERHIGHVQIRNRGTFGGSLAHADPSAELPAVMVALDAVMRIAGPSGRREVPAAEFFLMYFTTCLGPGEMLTEVRVPCLPPHSGYAFAELSRRSGDFALAGVACTLTLDGAGVILDCRLGLTGVGMIPLRATEAEALLRGRAPTLELFAEAARYMAGAVMPDSDVHATAEYRTHLAGVLTQRALHKALERAGAGDGPNRGGEGHE